MQHDNPLGQRLMDSSAPLATNPLMPQQTKPATPSQWFADKFPAAFTNFGTPFLETSEHGIDFEFRRVVEMNNDFFAAALGGDERLGHRVVFYRPEGCFYFRDVDGTFYPTDETKLATLLSALLLRCAEEMPATVDRRNLFVDFRKESKLNEVVRKACCILAVDASFFSADSLHRRVAGAETLDQTARSFVDSSVAVAEGTLKLTVGELFAAFLEYCRLNGVQIKQQGDRKLKRMVVETVNQYHGVRLRHDLMDSQGRCAKGWSGLMFRNRALNDFELAARN
ncbi:MAG: hypothetical protein ABMA26_25260 [Limisphaerales bacterium]